MPQTTPGQREAQALCKSIMVTIRNFVLFGRPLDAFTTALLQRNEAAALRCVHPVIRREQVLGELMEFVEQHIPSGVFQTDEEITRWTCHNGLRGAPEEQVMWFRMMSPWWRRNQVLRLPIPAP